MENKRLEILFKRILFLTKIAFSFVIVVLILVLNFLDYKELRANSEYLSTLHNVVTSSGDKFSDEKLEYNIAGWLIKADSITAKKYSDSRKMLSKILIDYGAPISDIRARKGYDGGRNSFQAISIGQTETSDNNNYISTNSTTIEQSLKTFNYLARPIKLDVLTSVDTSMFKSKMDALPNDDDQTLSSTNQQNRKYFLSNYIFNGLVFKNDSIIMSLTENLGQEQRRPLEINISLPATHKEINAPSRLVFAGFDSVNINKIYLDSSTQKKIIASYGNLSIFKTDDLIDKSIANNSDSVSILGFDISRKWFPFAMLITLLFINVLIFKNLRAAKTENLKIISSNNSDDALEFLVTNKLLRFILWMLSSVLISICIYFTSFILYSCVFYIISLLVTLTTIIYGGLAFGKAKGL